MRIVVAENNGCKKPIGSTRNLFRGKSFKATLRQVLRGKMENGTEFGAS